MAMMKTALAVLAAAAMCTAGVATATESGAEALMRALGGEVHGADVQHSSGCCMPPAFSLVSRSYSDGSVTSQMIGLDRSNPQSLEFFSVYQETSSSDTIQTIINGNKGYYIRYSASGADPTCYNFPPPADMFGGEDFCVGPGHHHSEYVSSMKVAGVSAEIWIVPGTAYGTAASCGPSGSRVLGNGGLTNFTVMFNQTDSLPPGYTTPPSFCSTDIESVPAPKHPLHQAPAAAAATVVVPSEMKRAVAKPALRGDSVKTKAGNSCCMPNSFEVVIRKGEADTGLVTELVGIDRTDTSAGIQMFVYTSNETASTGIIIRGETGHMFNEHTSDCFKFNSGDPLHGDDLCYGATAKMHHVDKTHLSVLGVNDVTVWGDDDGDAPSTAVSMGSCIPVGRGNDFDLELYYNFTATPLPSALMKLPEFCSSATHVASPADAMAAMPEFLDLSKLPLGMKML